MTNFLRWLAGERYKPTPEEMKYIRSRGYKSFADYVPSYEEPRRSAVDYCNMCGKMVARKPKHKCPAFPCS